MNVQQYNRQLKAIDKELKQLQEAAKPLQHQRNQLISIFKHECKHPVNQIHVHANHYEDEYGKWMESWTDYDYTCVRCDTTIRKCKKFTNVKELQQALDKAVEEYYPS